MGWGDAWAGLSQQAMGFAIDSLRSKEQQKYQAERDEIARRAAEDQERERRKYEEKMQAQKMKFEKELRADDQAYRSKESEMDRKLRREESEADRGLRERSIRIQEQYANRSGGLAQPKAPDSVLSQANKDFVAEVERLVAEGRTPEQAQGEAFAKLQSIYDRDILSRIRPGLSSMQSQVSRTAGALGRKAGDVMQYFNP